jgi:hypothetical protein
MWENGYTDGKIEYWWLHRREADESAKENANATGILWMI